MVLSSSVNLSTSSSAFSRFRCSTLWPLALLALLEFILSLWHPRPNGVMGRHFSTRKRGGRGATRAMAARRGIAVEKCILSRSIYSKNINFSFRNGALTHDLKHGSATKTASTRIQGGWREWEGGSLATNEPRARRVKTNT